MVLLAYYRGTKVAVKRVIPAEEKDDETNKTSGALSQFFRGSRSGDGVPLARSSLKKQKSKHWRASLIGDSQTRSRLQADFVSEMRLLAKLRNPSTTVIGT